MSTLLKGAIIMSGQEANEDYEPNWENEGGAVVPELQTEGELKNNGNQSYFEEDMKDLEKFGDPPGGEA